jgi:prepilin-type N-terminal cleavage/methylation domain-containing protein
MNIIKSKKQKAFTLIETLVAISILMISIAGPLTVASKGYTSALDARNQSVAIYLAQEGLEYLSYQKDNKLWGDWSPGVSFKEAAPAAAECDFDNLCSFQGITENGNNVFGALPTGFSRIYYFTPHNDYQITASVRVTWNTALLNGSIQLDQVFTNYER